MNFLGLPGEFTGFATSRVHVLPIPYEATTSYGVGARNGPAAIISASSQVELYDIELGFEAAAEWGIHTLPTVVPDTASNEAAVASIEAAVADAAQPGKLLCVLGGEHTTSVGVARGLHQVHGDFVTVQLDAHADLRDEYEQTPYSHACAARRILELGGNVIQFGIRSLDITEAEFIKANPDRVTVHYAHAMRHDRSYLTSLAAAVRGKRVFLTIDVDAFDPSLIPATGTPEPGGLLWHDVLDIIRVIATEANVIAFDIVELAPIPGMHAPDFVIAKMAYKTMCLILGAGG